MYATTSLFVLCALAAVYASDAVLSLDGSNFHEHFGGDDQAGLVKFYAPWCGHCKNLAPHYEAAAAKLKGATVAKVDCDQEKNKALCAKYEVKGFPTLLWISEAGKTVTKYQGARTTPAIVKYVETQTGNFELTEIKDADHLDTFTEGVTAIVFFGAADSDEYKAFRKLYTKAEIEAEWAVCHDAATIEKTNSAKNYIKVFGENTAVLDAVTDGADTIKWLAAQTTPIVQDASKIRDTMHKFQYLVFVVASDDDAVKTASTVAKDFRETAAFFKFSDAGFKAKVVQAAGLDKDVKEPTLAVLSFLTATGEKVNKPIVYPFGKDFTEESIRAYMKDLADQKVEKLTKSEEIPATNDGDVYVMTNKAWDNEVVATDKHVFVEIYAPWCGHCKTLAPEWEKLGAKYKGTNVRVAKIDGTANDVPYDFKGFPTLVFYKAGSKDKPIPYEGAREFAALDAFVAKHTAKDEL